MTIPVILYYYISIPVILERDSERNHLTDLYLYPVLSIMQIRLTVAIFQVLTGVPERNKIYEHSYYKAVYIYAQSCIRSLL